MQEDFEDVFDEELAEVPEEQFDPSRFVGKRGPWDANVVYVGEAPGSTEVEQGEPFVGSAGRVLDEVMADVGIDRDAVYVTNLVKVRPPENRDPHRTEIDAWRPLLEAELERVDPIVVVTLGAVASQELLGRDEPLGELRGDSYEVGGRLVVPTYHPAATFYSDDVEDALRSDLRRVADQTSSS